MNIQDRRKTLTVEELRRRYNLDALDKDRKAIKLQKDQIIKVDAELNDFVEITTKNLKELQDQVDGNITTWFFNGVPTVENEPASNWTTDTDKNNHLGDLYYDQDTGYAYRWAYENNTYVWSKIIDADVVEALAVANAAQDTADSKRRVFVVQPTPPYDIGDIWIKEDTDLYRCRASRSEGSFNIADWIRATNYTDDTVALGTKAELDQFKTQITENYVSNATLETTVNSITGKVEETYTYITTVEAQVNDITTTTQTSTGQNELYITDSLESNALEYHVEGKSEQETRSGKNLFNYIDNFNTSVSGLTNTINSDGSITVSGISTANYVNIVPRTDITPTLTDGEKYTLSQSSTDDVRVFLEVRAKNKSTGNVDAYYQKNKSFTVNLSTYDYDIALLSTTIANWGTETKTITGFYQLEKGSTATEFEKYGASPSPDYPSEIKTIPSIRNLFDIQSTPFKLNVAYNSNGVQQTWANYYGTTEFTKINPNKNYIVSSDLTFSVLQVIEYDKNKNFIQRINQTKKDFVTSQETEYIKLSIQSEQIPNYFQIEEGLIAHDYVPYGAWTKVKITGKNILPTNVDSWKQGTYNTTTGVISSSTIRLILKDYLKVESNQTYTISLHGSGYVFMNGFMCDENGENIQQIPLNNLTKGTFTTNNECKKIMLGVKKIDDATITPEEIEIIKPQLEENPEPTEYEAYKEKEVLIDLSKPNLFDSSLFEEFTSGLKFINLQLKPNTVYTMSSNYLKNKAGIYGNLFFYNTSGSSATGTSDVSLGISRTITTGSDGIGRIAYRDVDSEYSNEATDYWYKIFEGYTDYYELSSIGDTKDELEVVSGVLTNNIGKIILNGNESWQVHGTNVFKITGNFPITTGNEISNSYAIYDINVGFTDISQGIKTNSSGTVLYLKNINYSTVDELKTGLSNNNVVIQYPLAEPQQITLPNTNIELFEGVNHITLVDDLETTTSIKYYRNTPISQDYVIQQQLDETNSNLSATTDKTNQNASDINSTNTNLNNNYYNKDQIDVMNTSTQEIITQIKNTVETTTTATNLQISILQEQLANGVTSIKTETGYTFDKDGLKIQKSDSEMSSLLDNDGFVVKRNETEVLTVRSSGVETENLTVRTYFTIGDNTRVENYKNGTGFFYVGGAS